MIPGEHNQDYRKLSKILNKLKYKKPLDIGCGEGLYLKILKNSFGVDISINALKKAKKNSENVVLADARRLPFKEKSFDLILSIEVVTHIDKKYWKEVFNEIDRVLKKNGIIILSMHNKKRYNKEISELIDGIKIFWVDVNEVLKFLKKYKIEKILYVNILPQRLQSFEFFSKHKLLFKILAIVEDLISIVPFLNKKSLEFIVIARKKK